MSWCYRTWIRPILFQSDSERIHNHTLATLAKLATSPGLIWILETFHGGMKPLPVELFGLRFPNPVGLAAGMDKAAAALPAWAALGFGFSEMGGVTWWPQPGNPLPRMFRVVRDRALINRMGFNNQGAMAMAERLKAWRHSGSWPDHPVGINLGKSKITPLEKAAGDYADSFRTLAPLADFFVVNVSSPNTPQLRQLQDKSALDEILAALQEVNHSGATPCRPLLVKVAPDLSLEALDEILELAGPRKLAGLVATNTTIARPGTQDPARKGTYSEAGGLSGAPLKKRSTEVVRHLFKQSKGSLPIIGVGGIFNSLDAWEKIQAGASLVQLYSGLVYEGPSIAGEIVAGLAKKMKERGMDRWEQAVGCDG